jgi:hypothetical protein
LLPSFPLPPEFTTTRDPETLLLAKKLLNGSSSLPLLPSPDANWINSDEFNPTMLDASKPEMADLSTSLRSLPNAVMESLKETRSAITVLPTLTLPPMLAEEIADSLDVVMESRIRESNVTEPPTVPKLVLSLAPELRLVLLEPKAVTLSMLT